MDANAVIGRLHQHRIWSNQQILQITADLHPDQLCRSFEIGQGSIWKTLTHLFAAEYVWLEALCGNANPLAPGDVPGQLPGNQHAEDAMRSLGELRSSWDKLDERWNCYLAGATPESLNEDVQKLGSLTNQLHSTKRIDILLHVCTHAQYTTAQLVNMLRHVGVTNLPDTMLITMSRMED